MSHNNKKQVNQNNFQENQGYQQGQQQEQIDENSYDQSNMNNQQQTFNPQYNTQNASSSGGFNNFYQQQNNNYMNQYPEMIQQQIYINQEQQMQNNEMDYGNNNNYYEFVNPADNEVPIFSKDEKESAPVEMNKELKFQIFDIDEEIEQELGEKLYQEDCFLMDEETLDTILALKTEEIACELKKFETGDEDDFSSTICFQDLLGNNLLFQDVSSFCRESVQFNSMPLVLDHLELQEDTAKMNNHRAQKENPKMKVELGEKEKESKETAERFEVGMLSISNKRVGKDDVVNTTYNTVIAGWKKKEKEEVRAFNELLNKVVLDKIDAFKAEVVTLFEQINEKFPEDTHKKDREELHNELSIGLLKKAMNDHKLSQNYAKLVKHLNQKDLKAKYKTFHVQVLRHFLDISSANFGSFLNMESLVNTMTSEEIEKKIAMMREGAQKFTGFLIIEEYFTPKVLETILNKIMRIEQKLSGAEYIKKFGLDQLDSVIELFNRCGHFLDNHYTKSPDKQHFVSKFFHILEKIHAASEGHNDYLRINLKILNIVEDRKAGWIALKNKHNLMTKEQVNRVHIMRQEGKETNLVEERNRVLQEKKDKPEKKQGKSNNQFSKLGKRDESDDEDDLEEEDKEEADGSYEDLMNFAEKVYQNYYLNKNVDEKKAVTIDDVEQKLKEQGRKSRTKLIAYLYIFSQGKEEQREYLKQFEDKFEQDTIDMLKKVCAVFSCIIDDVPLLEDQIGRFICDHLLKDGKSITNLDLGALKDSDHQDLSKVNVIFLQIIRLTEEEGNDYCNKQLIFSLQALRAYKERNDLLDAQFDAETDDKIQFHEDMSVEQEKTFKFSTLQALLDGNSKALMECQHADLKKSEEKAVTFQVLELPIMLQIYAQHRLIDTHFTKDIVKHLNKLQEEIQQSDFYDDTLSNLQSYDDIDKVKNFIDSNSIKIF